jgi:hypothetical protein
VSPQENEKISKKRKYSEDYVKFGFTCCLDRDGTEKPVLFCAKVLCNDNMRPAKLQEHFTIVHPGNSGVAEAEESSIPLIRYFTQVGFWIYSEANT